MSLASSRCTPCECAHVCGIPPVRRRQQRMAGVAGVAWPSAPSVLHSIGKRRMGDGLLRGALGCSHRVPKARHPAPTQGSPKRDDPLVWEISVSDRHFSTAAHAGRSLRERSERPQICSPPRQRFSSNARRLWRCWSASSSGTFKPKIISAMRRTSSNVEASSANEI